MQLGRGGQDDDTLAVRSPTANPGYGSMSSLALATACVSLGMAAHSASAYPAYLGPLKNHDGQPASVFSAYLRAYGIIDPDVIRWLAEPRLMSLMVVQRARAATSTPAPTDLEAIVKKALEILAASPVLGLSDAEKTAVSRVDLRSDYRNAFACEASWGTGQPQSSIAALRPLGLCSPTSRLWDVRMQPDVNLALGHIRHSLEQHSYNYLRKQSYGGLEAAERAVDEYYQALDHSAKNRPSWNWPGWQWPWPSFASELSKSVDQLFWSVLKLGIIAHVLSFVLPLPLTVLSLFGFSWLKAVVSLYILYRSLTWLLAMAPPRLHKTPKGGYWDGWSLGSSWCRPFFPRPGHFGKTAGRQRKPFTLSRPCEEEAFSGSTNDRPAGAGERTSSPRSSQRPFKLGHDGSLGSEGDSKKKRGKRFLLGRPSDNSVF